MHAVLGSMHNTPPPQRSVSSHKLCTNCQTYSKCCNWSPSRRCFHHHQQPSLGPCYHQWCCMISSTVSFKCLRNNSTHKMRSYKLIHAKTINVSTCPTDQQNLQIPTTPALPASASQRGAAEHYTSGKANTNLYVTWPLPHMEPSTTDTAIAQSSISLSLYLCEPTASGKENDESNKVHGNKSYLLHATFSELELIFIQNALVHKTHAAESR